MTNETHWRLVDGVMREMPGPRPIADPVASDPEPPAVPLAVAAPAPPIRRPRARKPDGVGE